LGHELTQCPNTTKIFVSIDRGEESKKTLHALVGIG